RGLDITARSIAQTDGERDAVPKRHVLIEERIKDRGSTELRNAGRITKRRLTGIQLAADEGTPEGGCEPEDIDERPAGDIGHTYPHAGLNGEEVRTVDPAQRLSKVIDAGRVQVARSVACHIHANL